MDLIRRPLAFAPVIDKSGEWWKGTQFNDLAEYMRELTADGYQADWVRQSECECGVRGLRGSGRSC